MLKQIQKSLGDKEAGLVEFKERDVASPGTEATAGKHAMNTLSRKLALTVVWATVCATAIAADKVKLIQGSQSSGKLTGITPTELVLEGPLQQKDICGQRSRFGDV